LILLNDKLSSVSNIMTFKLIPHRRAGGKLLNRGTNINDVANGRADLAFPGVAEATSSRRLPVPVQAGQRTVDRGRRGLVTAMAVLVVILAGGGGGFYWWQQARDQLPAGISWSNGRIEADEIDIDTKFAGRIAELAAGEGDMVTAGQIVARMDVRDLEASLKRAEAQLMQAQKAVDEARAMQEQQRSQLLLARQQLDRTTYLVERGNATRELLDQRKQLFDGAVAGLDAASARVAQAEHALTAAAQAVEVTKVNIADNMLAAPRDGRIQYRIANVGEVLGAGGHVFSMIDIASVYMDIFLPTLEAGQVKVGAEARIVLDAYPAVIIPAKVSFIATQSQFTPKTVETRTERDRLMFRVRVRIDPELLRARAEAVRSGLPGLAYVLTGAGTEWPPRLRSTVGK
jgi:HlyD family secretion protein